MYNKPWIERSPFSTLEIPPEEAALRATYESAQKTVYHLVCASNELSRSESPTVKACASVVRDALHAPENDRANAIKSAELAVLHRQVEYISTLTYFTEHREVWTSLRRTLVSQLAAVALHEQDRRWYDARVDINLSLNCQAVADLIDEGDSAAAEESRHRNNEPTREFVDAGFQKVFGLLVAEVTVPHWAYAAKLSCQARHNQAILRDLPLDRISSTSVPAKFEKCSALYDAREAFETAFNYATTTKCRDWYETNGGSFKDAPLSERLLRAMPDVSAMQRIEQERDNKLRTYAHGRRTLRHLIDNCQALFVQVAELLPEAVAEVAAIKDDELRRRAQNLCLFAARRLRENLRYIRECDSWIGAYDTSDLSAAVNRAQLALIERIKSKQIEYPSTRRRARDDDAWASMGY